MILVDKEAVMLMVEVPRMFPSLSMRGVVKVKLERGRGAVFSISVLIIYFAQGVAHWRGCWHKS